MLKLQWIVLDMGKGNTSGMRVGVLRVQVWVQVFVPITIPIPISVIPIPTRRVYLVLFFIFIYLFIWLLVTTVTSSPSQHYQTPRWQLQLSSDTNSNPREDKQGICRWMESNREGGNNKNGPKQCQMRRLGLMWVQVFFLRVFLLLTNLLQHLYVLNYEITLQRVRWKVEARKMGQNDARQVVLARWVYFLFLSCFSVTN